MKTKRVLFERLTWGEQATPSPALPDEDSEAVAALMALGGFQCPQCAGPLSAANGYSCCDRPYCPYCGQSVKMWNSTCPHFVLYRGRHRWKLELHQAFRQARAQAGDDEDAIEDAWQRLVRLTPPARRLPGQRQSGYPRWTAEQLDSAYAPDVRPHLETIFGLALRDFNMVRMGPVLLQVAQPDVHTTFSDAYYHWADGYFSADPQSALARVEAFLQAIERGTQTLRSMPPETLVRPPYDVPESGV